MNGNNIVIYIGNTPIASTKSDKLQFTGKTKNISSPMTGDWKKHKRKRKGWVLTTDFLIMSASEVASRSLQIGKTVQINVIGTGRTVYTGNAICVKCDEHFVTGALAKGSWEFHGTDEFVEWHIEV